MLVQTQNGTAGQRAGGAGPARTADGPSASDDLEPQAVWPWRRGESEPRCVGVSGRDVQPAAARPGSTPGGAADGSRHEPTGRRQNGAAAVTGSFISPARLATAS